MLLPSGCKCSKDSRMVKSYFEFVSHFALLFPSYSYPQAPLTDRLPNGGKAVNLPNAEGIEFGTLGIHHIDNVGREGLSKDETFTRVHRMSNPCTLKINELGDWCDVD